ncbi:hypothetical protein RQP46_011508 [Phenoliferia psychrophenolica]
MTRFQYLWLYILVIKSVAVYIDTCVALLASNHWSGSILQSAAAKNGSNVLTVPFSIGKWVFTGCIIFSFLLLLWEGRKSRAIIRSRDISYAFTNVTAQNWYSMRSYDHFCFFSQIDNSKKKKDEFAFFIFFTFKGAGSDYFSRMLLANTLYSFGSSEQWTTDVSVYFGGSVVKAGIIITMLFTLVIWVGSMLLLLVAAFMYVPLLCYIQGNLKEYCCHKVDKRIAELMKRKTRKRLAKEAEIARKEAAGDYSHLRDAKTGRFNAAPLPQPTLPKIGMGDEYYASSETSSIKGGYGGGGGYGAQELPYQYPPMSDRKGTPAPSAYNNNNNAYPYTHTEPDLYASANSLVGLTGRAAPMGQQGYDSTTSLVGGGGGRPDLQRGMTATSHAPSYRSTGTDEKGGYYDYVDACGAPPIPPPNAHPATDLQRNASASTYQAPSRQQLYERTAKPNSDSSELGYAQDDAVPGYTGGWEETRQAPLPQEYYEEVPRLAPQRPRREPALDPGNMAGRGRPGAGGSGWGGR